jgi:hypothetical protein
VNDFILSEDECVSASNRQSNILQSLLEDDDLKDDDNPKLLLKKIQNIMAKADTILESPHNKFLWSAYGSCPLYSVDEGKRIFAIPYPHVYRFRGEKLKDLN